MRRVHAQHERPDPEHDVPAALRPVLQEGGRPRHGHGFIGVDEPNLRAALPGDPLDTVPGRQLDHPDCDAVRRKLCSVGGTFLCERDRPDVHLYALKHCDGVRRVPSNAREPSRSELPRDDGDEPAAAGSAPKYAHHRWTVA